MMFYYMFGLPPLTLKSYKYNLSQKKNDLRLAYLKMVNCFFETSHILSKEEKRFVADQDMGWQIDRRKHWPTPGNGGTLISL